MDHLRSAGHTVLALQLYNHNDSARISSCSDVVYKLYSRLTACTTITCFGSSFISFWGLLVALNFVDAAPGSAIVTRLFLRVESSLVVRVMPHFRPSCERSTSIVVPPLSTCTESIT